MKIFDFKLSKYLLFTFYLLLFTCCLPKLSLAQDEKLEVEDFDYWAKLCRSIAEEAEDKREEEKEKLYEKAIEACNTAININPTEPVVWKDLGDIYFILKNYPKTVSSYDQVLRLEPNYSLIWAKQCLALSELGRQKDAIDACETALEKNQQWDDESPAIAWNHLGIALSRSGNNPRALFAYDWAVNIDKEYSLAWANRCEVLSKLGRSYRDYRDALQSCERAIALNQNWGHQNRAIAWANKGKILAVLKRHDEALFAYDQAVAIDSENARTWTERGAVLTALARYEEAQTSHDWALEISPKYSLALANKCATLNRMEVYDGALESCDMALQEGDGRWDELGAAYAWNQRGNALIGSGSFQEAASSTNRAIALRDNYYQAWSNRAVSLWRLGRFQDALPAAERAVVINPESSIAWYNLGRIHTTLGKFEEALAAYDQGLNGDANLDDESTLVKLWINRSSLFWRLERYGDAIQSADNALVLDSESPQAWYNRALSLMAIGRYSAAVESYDKAILVEPENSDFWTGKGIALRYLRNYPAAFEALKTALELNEANSLALSNLRVVLQKLPPPTQEGNGAGSSP